MNARDTASWWKRLFRLGGKAILLFAGFVLVIALTLIVFVGSQIKSTVYAFTSRAFFIPDGLAALIAGILILTLSATLAWQIVKMSSGRGTRGHYIGLAVMLIASLVFSYATRHEVFGEGKSDTYICLSSKAGGLPSIKKTPIDPVTGLECIPNTSKNSQITQAIIDGDRPPQRLVFTTASQLDGVFVFRNGTQWLYKSAEMGNDGLPIIYTGLWFDDATGGYLKPATNDDLKRIRDALERRERLTAASAWAEQERKAEAEKRQSEENKRVQQQATLVRQQQEAAERRAREEQAKSIQREKEIQDELRRIAAEDKARLRQTMLLQPGTNFTVPTGFFVSAIQGEHSYTYADKRMSERPLTKQDFIRYNGTVLLRAKSCLWCKGARVTIEPFADIATRDRLPSDFVASVDRATNPPQKQAVNTQAERPTPSTGATERYVLFEFIGRDAPAAFTFGAGRDDTNKVNPNVGSGIRLTGVNLPCDTYLVYVDEGSVSGGGVARREDLCQANKFVILPGEIYTVRNKSNVLLFSRNVRVD